MSKKFIQVKCLPPRLGIGSFVLYWLFLDRLNAPGWVYGVVGTLLILGWIVELIKFLNGLPIDIFEEGEIENGK